LKFCPAIVTIVPGPAAAGDTEFIIGFTIVKLEDDVPKYPLHQTLIVPDISPGGNVATI